MHFPLASAIASRLVFAEESSSTNRELRAHAKDPSWPHLSVLVTDHQTEGRGRLDRSWIAPKGTAVAVSVLLRDLPEDPLVRGWIPLVAGLALADSMTEFVGDHHVGVKWPNDVLVDEKKICGILAEIEGDAVIVGAGVNTAMTEEQLPVPTATSFAALGIGYDADRLLAAYLAGLSGLLGELRAGNVGGVRERVSQRCITIGRQVTISLPDGAVRRGLATRLAEDGRLVVEHDGGEEVLSVGDVVHARLS